MNRTDDQKKMNAAGGNMGTPLNDDELDMVAGGEGQAPQQNKIYKPGDTLDVGANTGSCPECKKPVAWYGVSVSGNCPHCNKYITLTKGAVGRFFA